MEDTLREGQERKPGLRSLSLNPCFNGRYSQRRLRIRMPEIIIKVLILVLMEDTLRGRRFFCCQAYSCTVLILVLMEDTLRAVSEERSESS